MKNLLESESFRAIFWRRILKGEITIETQLSQDFSLMSSTVVPNLVCVIQGFVSSQDCEKKEGWEASSVVQKTFYKTFSDIGHEVYFVPFHKHAALLLKIPSEIASPSFWKEGENAIVKAIDVFKRNLWDSIVCRSRIDCSRDFTAEGII